MDDLLKKLSSYNIANHLLPGAIYTFVLCSYLGRKDIVDNLVLFFFIAYFSGVVVSRIGSLVIERLLRLIWKKGPYEDFLAAEKDDPKLQALVEDQNLFRSVVALAVVLYLSLRYLELRANYPSLQQYDLELGAATFIVLFIIAHLSHDRYINKRIAHHKKRK